MLLVDSGGLEVEQVLIPRVSPRELSWRQLAKVRPVERHDRGREGRHLPLPFFLCRSGPAAVARMDERIGEVCGEEFIEPAHGRIRLTAARVQELFARQVTEFMEHDESHTTQIG